MRLDRKAFGRVATTFVATAMLAAFAAVPASALDNYTAINGGTMTFDKYLVMDAGAEVPTASFSFNVEAGDPVPGTATHQAILAGVEADKVVDTDTADFTPGMATHNAAQSGDTVTLTSGKKYAVDEVTVDFSQVSFPKPGIYRYKVTETASSIDGITNDTNNVRYIDVYVTNGTTDGTLQVSQYLFHKSANVATSANGLFTDPTEKEAGFTNTYATQDITLTKQVEGTQGDKSKEFRFTIKIDSDGDSAKKYDICQGDSVLKTLDSGVENTVDLKNGESVTIKGLSAKDVYTITETDYTADGYQTKYASSTSAITGTSDTVNAQAGLSVADMTTADATYVTFYNIKDYVTPTGVLLNVAPYAVMVIIAAAGCFVFLRKRRDD